MENPKVYVFVGKSGSGKGTQADLLIEDLKRREDMKDTKILYLETGQRLRGLISSSTYTAKIIQEIIQSGGLVPPFLAIWNWSEAMVAQLNGGECLIMDGTPRTVIEAMAFYDALKFYGYKEINFIHLDVTDEAATERLLKRARGDDDEARIRRRLNWFHSDVWPAVEYFRDKPEFRFIDIDGMPPIEEVHQAIVSRLWSA